MNQYNLLEEHDLFDPVQHYNRASTLQRLERYTDAIREYELYLRRASPNRDFEEDEHFHMAFEKIKECQTKLKSD